MNPYDFTDAQDLLEECKRRYPIGSYFRCASVSTDICLVEKSTYDNLRYDEDYNYYSVGANVDVSAVGTLEVDFGLPVFITNENDRNTGYMVRNNRWAKRCDHNGDLYVDIPKTQSSGFKFNIGDIVVVCKKGDDPTDYGYWNTVAGFAKISGVGDIQGTIINSIKKEHGIYYQINSLFGNNYIHEARLKLVISIQSQSNTTKNGKEHTARSGTESAKICRPNQQISESTPIRRVGLKGSGSKIRLGGDNRHH